MHKRTRGEVSNVDYTLLYKKQIIDYLESLKNKEQTILQMDESMNKLFLMGKQVIPVCLSKLKENDEAMASVACYALEYANDYSVVDPLLNILIMPSVSDKIKARILAVLSHYGVDAGDLPLDIIMKDFDKMASDSLMEMLDDIGEDPFLIPYILDDLEEFSPEMKVAYIKDLGDQHDERAILLLEIMATIDDPLVAQAAIKALGKIKSGKALYVLYKLENLSTKDSIKRLAGREAQRLKFKGISMETFDPWKKLTDPIKIYVSSIDGLGSRALWVAWRNPFKSRKISFMNLLINTQLGIKDCWGVSHISTREFNSSVKDFSKTTSVVECSLDYALTLIGDAIFTSEEIGYLAPYQFFFWKHLIEKHNRIRVQPYRPVFLDDDLDFKCTEEESLKETFDLFNYRFFCDWFIADSRVYDFAEENKSKRGYVLKKMTYQKAEKLFMKFTAELIEPEVDNIKRMLELSVDFLVLAGEREIAKCAFCALLNMDRKPLHYHPFIQRMIIESIKVALNNMKNGFDMRVNPEVFD